MDKRIIIVAIIVAVVILGVIIVKNVSNGKKVVDTLSDNSDKNLELDNKIENTVSNTETNEIVNTLTENNTISNNVSNTFNNNVENKIASISTVKTTDNEEKSPEVTKATEIAKEAWGDDNSVSYDYEGQDEKGNYIISIRDKRTTRAYAFYHVNIETGKYEVK